jgi:predicted transposase YdaD
MHSRPGQPLSQKRRRKKNRHHHQELDALCKSAMERDGGRLLALIFTPEVCTRLGLPQATPRLVEILPTELRRKRLHADYLIKVDIGGVLLLLHIEFQNRPDPDIAARILQYEVAAYVQHRLRVFSVVFNVVSQGAQAVLLRDLDCGGLHLDFIEVTVPQAARQWGAQVTSPLAVLLSVLMGEMSDEELTRCLARLRELGLDEETCRELVEALCLLLDIRRRGPHDLTRKRLFMKLRMQETWLFQEGKDQGIQEGIKEGKDLGIKEERQTWLKTLQGTAVDLCTQRFGADAQGIDRIRQIQEPTLLSRLIVLLATAPSLPAALDALPA